MSKYKDKLVYDTIEDGQIDNFSQLEEVQHIYVDTHDVSSITEVKFTQLGDIASNIGGFNNFVMLIFGFASSMFFYMFLKKIAR